MRDLTALQDVLDPAEVDPSVHALRADHRTLLLAVDGLEPGPSDEHSGQLLQQAEASVRRALADQAVEQQPHVPARREAYRALGAKPQRTRSSVEALRRVSTAEVAGLPLVDRLTDVDNSVSVLHQVPLGGEDLDRWAAPPRLVRAAGQEPFDTTAGGETVVEHPEAGEVVWCDDAGVTCRRWNWRPTRCTQLTDGSTAALFVLDVLARLTDADLQAAADDLVIHLRRLGPDVGVAQRLLSRS